MEQLLRKVLERRDLHGARMVAGAVRTRYMSNPVEVMQALEGWVEYPDPAVRIAAGHALGTITVRNPDILPRVMPLVESLANDQASEVRREGATAALELLWLYHYDSIWIVMEDWFERKNDLVRRVAIETMGRIVKGSRINRPSTLKQFIDRSMAIIDRLVLNGNPDLRPTLAATVNEFGLKAGDLISPWVSEWAGRPNLNSLTLARDILGLPFGEYCRGLDRDKVLRRVAEEEAAMVRQVASWLRTGQGRMEYFTVMTDRLLTENKDPAQPHGWWADPYRGCQFRCEFCSMRSLSEYSGQVEEDFLRRVVVVTNAAEALSRELRDPAWDEVENQIVRIGVNCDPYQPAEERFRITRDMLKMLLENENPVILQTRSDQILRDLDLIERLADRGLINVMISLPSPIEGIRKKVEIGIPPVVNRLKAIEILTGKGVPVGLAVSPILPQLTDHPETLEEVVRRGAEAGAAFVVPEVLNLSGSAGPKMLFFLESFIPSLLPQYQKIFTERGGREMDEAYVKRICEELIPSLAEKHGANRDGLRLTAEGLSSQRMLSR